MIAEMFIKKYDGHKGLRVVVYPEKHKIEARVHDNPSKSSCHRLERMMSKYDARIYIRKRGISVWIAR